MKNRTFAFIGAGLLVAAVALGGLSTVLARNAGPGSPFRSGGYGPAGTMAGYGPGPAGMTAGYGYGRAGMMAGYGYGSGGMMAGYGYGPGGMMGRGGTAATNKPLASLDDAQKAFQSYIDRTENADLKLDEVMEFQQNFYAIVKEKSIGIGAFELLADKQTGAVFPEYGPNMMWNTKGSYPNNHVN